MRSLALKVRSLLVLALVGAHVLACRSQPEAPLARYTVLLSAPQAQEVVVRARFTGLAGATRELALCRYWAGYGDLGAQVAWVRLNAGRAREVLLERGAEDPLFVRWPLGVPVGGTWGVEYALRFAGQDGAPPSYVTSDHALLLSRSLFLVPDSWLAQPRAAWAGRVEVQVQAPAGWAVYAPWPANDRGEGYLPPHLEGLWDGALALGPYRGYALPGEAAQVHLLLSPAIGPAQAEALAAQLGQQILAVARFFGRSPTLQDEMTFWAVVATPNNLAEPTGMALGEDWLVLGTPATPPSTLPDVARRAAVELWSGGALRPGPRYGAPPLPAESWLSSGWSAYLSWRMALEARQVSAIAFWGEMRRLARRFQDPTWAETSLAQAVAQGPADPGLALVAREKGMLAALILDDHLRRDSGQRADLGMALRELWQRQNYYVTGRWLAQDQVVALLSELAGKDYAPLYRALVEETGPWDLAAIPELAAPDLGETRVAIAPDGVPLVYQWLDGPSRRVAIYLSDGPGALPYDLLSLYGEALRGYLDVAYLEQRGSGRSGRGGYSLDAFINDIEVLREDLGARQVVLLGHGWGGYCALVYAARYPERIDALILLSPIPSFTRLVQAELEAFRGQRPSLQSATLAQAEPLLRRGVTTGADFVLLQQLLAREGLFGSDLAGAEARLQALYGQWTELALLPAGIPWRNETILPTLLARDGLLQADPATGLGPGGYPALILRGQRDRVLSASLLQGLGKQIKGTYREIPGAGYLVHLDNPSSTLGEIIAFLEAHPQS